MGASNTETPLAGTDPGRPAPIAPLRFRDFRLISGGQLVSAIGTQMTVVAVAWQVYLLTHHSAVALGLIGVARGVPLILASLFAGVIADAYDRRKTLLVTQSILATLSALLATLTLAGMISVWAIYLLIAGISAMQAVDQPTRTAMVPNLVSREALPRALALLVAMREFATVLGPALGGLVIGVFGVGTNYVVDTISYAAVLSAVLLMHTRVGRIATGNVSLEAVYEGWRFIYHNRIILLVQGLDFLANFCGASTVLFPVFAESVYSVGPQGLGLLYAAASLGAVAGALAFGFFGRVRRQGAVILISIFVYGAAVAAFGFSRWFLVGLVFLVISGMADSVSATLRGTISQLETPNHLRGRVTAANTMFVAGGPQLGNVEAGLVAAAIGAQESVALGGLATMGVVAITAAWSKSIREYPTEKRRGELASGIDRDPAP